MTHTPLSIVARMLRADRGAYLLGALLLLLTNALGVIIPYAIGVAVDRVREGQEASALAALIAALALLVACVRTGSRLCILGASRRINYRLKTEVFAHMLALDRGYHIRVGAGELISRVAHDVRQIRSLCGPAALHSINMVFLYVLALAALLRIDPWLTAIALLPLPLMAYSIRRCSLLLHRSAREAQAALGTMTARVSETIGGLLVVRSYAAEDYESARFDAVSRTYRDANLSIGKARSLMGPLLALGSGLSTLAVLYYGGARVVDARLSLGQLVSFLSYLGMLAWPTFALGWVVNIYQRARPALERVCELLETRPAVAADGAPLPDPRGDLSVHGLTWSYPGATRPALIDVDLEVPAGQRVALVGRVGSGKSTLLALLTRLYPAAPGALRLDGLALDTLRTEDVRRAVVQVPQEAFLFSRPIDENIAYGRPGADDGQIRGAARQARIDREIEGFVDGYRTWVGERGVTLSGGQRQRTTMARALLTEPAVLILDDATSSLDAATEQSILDELFGLREGRTTVLVTHRTSAARRCDRIIVLDDGRVEATGTPDEVLASSPTFQAMAEQERLRGELAAMRAGRVAPVDVPDAEAPAPVESDGDVRSDPTREQAPTGRLLDRRTVGRLMALAAEQRALVLLTLALIPIIAVAQLGPPLVIKYAVDDVIAAGTTVGLGWVALAYVSLIAVAFGVDAGQRYALYLTGERVTYALRARLHAHVLRLQASFFDRTPVGRVLTRITSDTVALGELFSQGVVTIAANAVLLTAIVGAMLWLSPALALWALALTPVLGVLAILINLRLGRAFRQVRARISIVNSALAEALSGVAVIQLFRAESRAAAHFDGLASRELEAELQGVRWDSIQSAMVELSGTLSIAVLLWAGGSVVAAGAATIGALVAFVDYVRLFYTPIRELAAKYAVLQHAAAGAEKVFGLLDVDQTEPVPATPAALDEIAGALRFDRVDFAYGDGPPVLRGVDLDVAAGEQLGVVGPTGAGKSTLVKLLCGHYRPTQGDITLDGVSLTEVDPRALRRTIGMVPQDVFLFGDTVRANLTLGREIDDERLRECLAAAEALDLVDGLPGGLDHVLAERGTDLSAGQRQLLAFARVLAHDPPVLVLDEATSAIDHQTEGRLQRALDAVLAGRTAVVIAHRLSTLERVDRIAVVEDGRLVELGTHDELLARRGVYWRLHRLQFSAAV